jgi:hypothetical protein
MTLFVSLALVRGFSDGSIDPADHTNAESAAVYLHNPLAMHIRDFMLADYSGDRHAKLLAATNDARAFGRGLAETLACPAREQFGSMSAGVHQQEQFARRDPLDELPESWRDWLTVGLGFEAEMQGGGCYALRTTRGGNGWSVLLTCAGGGGMPDADSWHVGVYPPGDDAEAAWQEQHDATHGPTATITFRQAVNAAFAMAETGEAAPEPAFEGTAAGLVCDALVLLDSVESAWADEGGERGHFTDADGVKYNFTVTKREG